MIEGFGRGKGGRFGDPFSRFFFGALAVLLTTIVGCSLTKTRPVQEMSDTSAAIKAAKEVQADVLAPVLYREANEWFLKAKEEYKLKNYEDAEDYADKARTLAEQAEFEVLKNPGATRVDDDSDGGGDSSSAPQSAPQPSPTYDNPSSPSTPATPTPSTPPSDASDPKPAPDNGGNDPTQIQVPAPQ